MLFSTKKDLLKLYEEDKEWSEFFKSLFSALEKKHGEIGSIVNMCSECLGEEDRLVEGIVETLLDNLPEDKKEFITPPHGEYGFYTKEFFGYMEGYLGDRCIAFLEREPGISSVYLFFFKD